MVTRDPSNRRVSVGIGPASAIADLRAPKQAEVRALLPASPAIRWDGLDFGVQASNQTDDRSLDDDAAATLRGFVQFGGAAPFFWPRVDDQTSILRQCYTLLKVQGTDIVWVERIGWKGTDMVAEPFTAGDVVNTYLLTADGFKPDAEGDGGYAYLAQMLARGIAWPWTIIAGDTAQAVTIEGSATQTLAVGSMALRRATYLGNDVTLRGIWRSSDQTKVRVERGIIIPVASGTANIYCSFPGGTESAAVAVTVS